jgi:hypothetical protein
MNSATSLRQDTKGPFEQLAASGAPGLNKGRTVGRPAGLEFDPVRHVDAAEQEGGVDAVMDVAGVDIGHPGGAIGARFGETLYT